ncbi:MAG: hypothetical protein R2862_06545 [Thermoanaerobaculia bacterium]
MRPLLPDPRSPAAIGGRTRPLQFESARWSDEGEALALQLFSEDNKDRWIATVGLDDGAVRPFYRQSDPAWLGWAFTDYGWTRDGRSIWYLSEESGFSHLYVQTPGGARRASPRVRSRSTARRSRATAAASSSRPTANRPERGRSTACRSPAARSSD